MLSKTTTLFLLLLLLLLSLFSSTSFGVALVGNFSQEFDVTWGSYHVNDINDGQGYALSLDQVRGGAGFRSKKDYLFGRFDMQIKLIPENSAGTVTTFYLSSEGPHHDEIDFEFIGNASGLPYILHTNVYSQGKGDREQEFYLPFDPTKDYHTYSIVWNRHNIIWLVDNIPIRVHYNWERIGVPYPMNQPMKVYASLWHNNDWATHWGAVKIDWSKAPFVAYFRNYNANACVPVTRNGKRMGCARRGPWEKLAIDAKGKQHIKFMQSKFMVYDYCKDLRRYVRKGFPKECKRSERI